MRDNRNTHPIGIGIEVSMIWYRYRYRLFGIGIGIGIEDFDFHGIGIGIEHFGIGIDWYRYRSGIAQPYHIHIIHTHSLIPTDYGLVLNTSPFCVSYLGAILCGGAVRGR